MLMLLGMFRIFAVVIILGLFILYIVGLWNLFQKAGRKGWEAIIPFYNTWVLVEISGLAWWYALIIMLSSLISIKDIENFDFIVSIASVVATFFAYYNISKKLHKDVGFTILMTLFPVIMIPLVGLSSNYQFDDSVVVSEHGPIQNGTTQMDTSNAVHNGCFSDNTNQKNFCSYCGNSLDSNSKYCGHCGKEIK